MPSDPTLVPGAGDADSEAALPAPPADRDPQGEPAESSAALSSSDAGRAQVRRKVAREASSSAWRYTFSSLAIVDYRRLWLGQLLISAAFNMQHIARSYLVYELTGSGMLLGVVGAGAAMPMLALGLFGGAIADRLERRRLIQACQVGVTAIALFLGLAVTTDTVTWGYLLASSLLQGVVTSFLLPARQSIIPDIVGRANLSNALALNAAGMSVTTLGAPGVAGLLYALIGPEWVFYITGVMGLAAVVLTNSITGTRVGRGQAKPPMLADVKAGLAYVRGNSRILAILMLVMATFLFVHTVVFLLPAVVTDVYHRKSEAYGLLVSIEGAGALAGSLVFATMGASRRGRLLIVSSIGAGFALLLMSLVPLYVAAVAFMTALGVAEAGRRVLSQSLLMEESQDEYRGRVMSIYGMMAGLMPLGILPAGLALDLLGGQMTVGILAGATIAASVLVLLTQPSLRAMP